MNRPINPDLKLLIPEIELDIFDGAREFEYMGQSVVVKPVKPYVNKLGEMYQPSIKFVYEWQTDWCHLNMPCLSELLEKINRYLAFKALCPINFPTTQLADGEVVPHTSSRQLDITTAYKLTSLPKVNFSHSTKRSTYHTYGYQLRFDQDCTPGQMVAGLALAPTPLSWIIGTARDQGFKSLILSRNSPPIEGLTHA